MIKSIIFFGNSAGQSADDKFNEWIAKHADTRILNVQYQQARMGDHSIFVLYRLPGDDKINTPFS